MPLLLVLFLVFLAVPLVEIYLLIEVGSRIGAVWTLILVVGTAALGAALLRQQGLSTLNKIQLELARGQLPAVGLVEGLLLLLTGALLLTPGFATDTLGFILLIPPLRHAVAALIVHRQLLKVAGVVRPGQPSGSAGPGDIRGPNSGPKGSRTFDGDYERLDD
ncbi:MAG: FxsA family protein [Gammaproteobacteria bacterium]|nr:FxsA family protein [Gammaproteobacteria bacterium]